MKLATEYSVFIDLEHTENVFPQFDTQCCEVVHGVQAHQMPICAPYKDMFFEAISFLLHGDGTPDLLVPERLDGAMLFETLKIKHLDLFIRSIHKQQLLLAVLHVQLCYD